EGRRARGRPHGLGRTHANSAGNGQRGHRGQCHDRRPTHTAGTMPATYAEGETYDPFARRPVPKQPHRTRRQPRELRCWRPKSVVKSESGATPARRYLPSNEFGTPPRMHRAPVALSGRPACGVPARIYSPLNEPDPTTAWTPDGVVSRAVR